MKKLTVLAAVGALTAGCGLPGDEGDDEPAVIEGDWRVDRPARTSVAPGQVIELRVTGVDVPAKQLYVWLYDDALTLPPALVDDGAVKDDGELTISIWAPFFESGEHTYYLGDAEGHRSGAITANVEIPAPRLSKAEVARLLAMGMAATIGEVQGLLADPAPEWQSMWGSQYSATQRGTIDELMTELTTVAPLIEQGYNQLSDEHEAALQSFLEQRGILRSFEEGLALIASARVRPDVAIDFSDRLPHPISRVLYTLDFTSILLSATTDTLTVITVVSAIVPGLQPVSGVSGMVELVPIVIRFLIDNVVPTDLYDVSEEMVQEEMYREVSAHTFYWGTFSQEQRSATDSVGSWDNMLGLALGKLLGERASKYTAAIQEIVVTLSAKIGVSLPAIFAQQPQPPAQGARISTIMNMQLYSLTAGDLISLNPMASMFKFATFFGDIEIVDPFTVKSTDGNILGPIADGADILMKYRDDAMYFESVAWPNMSPLNRVDAYITAFSYRFTTSNFPYIVSIPYIDRVPEHQRRSRFWFGLDANDPHSTSEDNALLLDTIPGDTTYQYWFNDDSPQSVNAQLAFRDLAGGRPDVAKITVAVNGQVVFTDLELAPGADILREVALLRGKNTITVTATAGHVTGFDHRGRTYGTPVRVLIPEAANVDKDRTKYLNVGESSEIIIVTPPQLLTIPPPDPE